MSISISFNVESDAGLAELNAFMAGRSYLVGFSLTKSDVLLVDAIGKDVDAGKFPHLARYIAHIRSVRASADKAPAGVLVAKGHVVAAAGGSGAAAAVAQKAKDEDDDDEDDDDDDDLFGDDDDDDGAMLAAAKKAEEDAAKKKAGGKKKKIEKTSIVYELNGCDVGVDWEKVKAYVRGIEIEGLVWGEAMEVEPIAFGLEKLRVQAIILDNVEVADIEEQLEACELLSSIREMGMQKLT